MIKNKIKVVKDGAKLRVIVTEVDESRPAVELVGHEYRFNSAIVADKSFSAVKFAQLIGFGLDFKRGEISWKE